MKSNSYEAGGRPEASASKQSCHTIESLLSFSQYSVSTNIEANYLRYFASSPNSEVDGWLFVLLCRPRHWASLMVVPPRTQAAWGFISFWSTFPSRSSACTASFEG